MTTGYEIGTRVGNAATMGLFFRGFHPQGASGVFVAAASAGKMLDLNASRMQHALGIVGSQAGGLMAAQEGAMVKRFHSGRAAQSGVYSAYLAKRDFTGITDVLEAGYGGYLSSYSNTPNAVRLTEDLGQVWETAKVGYKPHACVTSIHSALDAFAHLLREHHLTPDDLANVDIGMSPMTYTHCAWEYKAQGVTAAQMNLYYGIAVIGFDGKAFVAQYAEDRLADPKIMDFIKRIHARVDSEIEAMGPAYRHAARVSVTTRDGRVFKHEILNRRGSPENPLSHEDVEYKFRNVVESCLSKVNIDRVIALTDRLDTTDDTSELFGLLAAVRYQA
jgi:2-methylcitrate dehydratase PrpD